jgi:hypothetical protein
VFLPLSHSTTLGHKAGTIYFNTVTMTVAAQRMVAGMIEYIVSAIFTFVPQGLLKHD